MPNTNPQAIAFANNKVRVFVDVLLSACETAESFEADYAALAGDTLFPNDAELIEDGSAVDGRPRVQNQWVRALRTIAQDLKLFAAANSPTRETRLRQIAVNGQSRW